MNRLVWVALGLFALGLLPGPAPACSLCGTMVEGRTLASPQKLENRILDLIKKDRPEWEAKRGICANCLEQYRAKKFIDYLEDEYRKLSEIEHSVVSKITRRGRVSRVVHQEFDASMTVGERAADKIAQFGGSWPFIGIFGVVLISWMVINTWVLAHRPFDPYPFILLNLVLSTLAALQAPVIMMSQNRQEEKDRLRADHDYRVNLKAEFEIRSLHEKIDHMLVHQWQRLIEIQQVQTDLLSELRSPKSGS